MPDTTKVVQIRVIRSGSGYKVVIRGFDRQGAPMKSESIVYPTKEKADRSAKDAKETLGRLGYTIK